MSEETKPKVGLAASIAEMAGPIFDKMAELPPGTQPPKPVVTAEAVATPPKPTVPGVNPDEPPHRDTIQMEGMEVEMPAEIKSENGRKAWKHYKKVTGEKISSLEAKIAELEKRPATPGNVADTSALEAKLAALEKEKSELSDRLGVVSLEHTPEFQQHYVSRAEEVIKEAKTIVGDSLAPKIEAILHMPDGEYRREKMAELSADLDDMQKAELGATVRELRKIQSEKSDQLKKWKENLQHREKMYQDRQSKQSEHTKKEMASVFESELSAIENPKDGVALFKPIEGNAEWNQHLEKAKSAARDLYFGENVTPQERAKAALWATSAPILIRQISIEREESAKLRARLEQLQGKQPQIKGDSGGEPAPAAHKPASLAERIANQAKEAGVVK